MYLVEYSVSRNPAQRWLKRKIRFSKIKHGVPEIPPEERRSRAGRNLTSSMSLLRAAQLGRLPYIEKDEDAVEFDALRKVADSAVSFLA